MSSTSETETEILLGNRHLLAIFFVLAILLGIAFTGGYMVGRNSSDKKSAPLAASSTDPAASTSGTAASPGATSLETHSLPPAGGEQADTSDQTHTLQPPAATDATPPPAKEEAPLGAPKEPVAQAPPAPPKPQPKPLQAAKPASAFAGPQSGQTFLQVMAVRRTEAEATAEVLSKKGFHAHAVPKPGSTEIYRVLIGPIHDASELAGTRDSLRNVGFTKIFVQRY
jgi:cell division septation protein DedD